MGWGTTFKTEIYLSRRIYRSIQELQNEINSLEDEIKRYETQLKMYAVSNPKDLVPDDVEVVPYLENLLNELLEMYSDDKKSYFQLKFLLEEAMKNPEILKNTD